MENTLHGLFIVESAEKKRKTRLDLEFNNRNNASFYFFIPFINF